jgi:hypothetical protein
MENVVCGYKGISISDEVEKVYLYAEYTKKSCHISLRVYDYKAINQPITNEVLVSAAFDYYIKRAYEKKIKMITLEIRPGYTFGIDKAALIKKLGFSGKLSEKNGYILKTYYGLSFSPERVMHVKDYKPLFNMLASVHTTLKDIEVENQLIQLKLTDFFYNLHFSFSIYYAGIDFSAYFKTLKNGDLEFNIRNMDDHEIEKIIKIIITIAKPEDFKVNFLKILDEIKSENRLSNLFSMPTKFFDDWCKTNGITDKEAKALLHTLLQTYDSATLEKNFAAVKSRKKANRSIRKWIDDKNGTHIITCLEVVLVIYKVNSEINVKSFTLHEMDLAEQFYMTISMELFADSLQKQIKKDS